MDEMRTRFLLEARAAGNLRHPAAVAIYDADHDPDTGLSFIAMEWVDGQSLDHLLEQEAPLSTDQAIAIICRIAGALDAAHHQGLIHRDVKPANILLDSQGDAKLSDFGIAKAESLELTSTGQVLGTPSLSPEQIRDKISMADRISSLSVSCSSSLTGQQPFQAASLPALTHKILHVDPVPPQPSTRVSRDPWLRPCSRPWTRIPTSASGRAPRWRRRWVRRSRRSMRQPIFRTPPPTLSRNRLKEQTRTRVTGGAGLLGALVLIVVLVRWARRSGRATRPRWHLHRKSRPPSLRPGRTPSHRTRYPVPARPRTLRLSWVPLYDLLHQSTQGRHAGCLGRWPARVDHFCVRGPRTLQASRGPHDSGIDPCIHRTSRRQSQRSWHRWQDRGVDRTGNTFEAGQTRRLRVELIPPSYFKLAWK